MLGLFHGVFLNGLALTSLVPFLKDVLTVKGRVTAMQAEAETCHLLRSFPSGWDRLRPGAWHPVLYSPRVTPLSVRLGQVEPRILAPHPTLPWGGTALALGRLVLLSQPYQQEATGILTS